MTAYSAPPSIPGYDVVRRLGTGATASVYQYHQRVPSRDVAIKVSATALDPRAAARFRNEANYMAQLSAHPYILSIHDAGVTSTGLGYIVLEYAPGGSYKELIREHPLTADQMLDLGIKLCSALFTAHCKGILHRDIKPANILITQQGLPVLADFGISTNVYQSGSQTGFSVPWAAPEVLSGHGGGTEAADIYSLAATLYATLAGRSPYENGYQVRTQQDLAQVIVSRPLPPIGRPDVPADVERVLRRGLDKNPDARYGTALEFARAMQIVQQQCYGHATPVTVEGVPEFPNTMRRRPDSIPLPPAAGTRAVARTGAWKKPVAIASGVVTVLAALGLVFAFVVMPHMDDAATRNRTAVTTPGTGGDGDDGSDSVTGADVVPSPENVTGTYSGDSVTFTWTNPSPKKGDSYAWSPVQQNGDAAGTSTNIVSERSVTLRNVTDKQTCIEVSIVRADKQMSQNPAVACAVRP
ncbi:serine/threonine-protein kinase [Bifidobacterium leontopitheci]|uniref:non-specific serine/threonine protein kinase n=1 Tax=Bifidobacterium leontopitheci TaxID=2650774 RepID=A0A6I1GQ05_9BIFI|nr:serine/threonine-protein kinase [Bifidobacterium leontopitheci]KAB7790178.1 kinase [Bifidobacterium leontopitheci]